MSAAPLVLPALDNTLGALFIGVVLAMGLWGAGSLQSYYYYNRYPDDDWTIKTLVAVVWILDTIHQGFITHSCYVYLVTQYANPAYLAIITPSLLWEVIPSSIICLFVQGFFVMRIWRLSHKNIWLVGTLSFLVVGTFILYMVYTALALPFGTYQNLHKIFNLSRSINAINAFVDVAIAGALIWLLQSSRTGFRSSENIINRLIIFTINTGFLTSLCAIMSLITISVFPNTFLYILFYVIISRLYTNSLLATLNARKGIRGGHPDSSENMSMTLSRMRGGRTADIEAPSQKTSQQHVLSVKVDTETTRDYYPEAGKETASEHTEVATYHAYSDAKAAI